METDIVFRGKSIETNEWIYGNVIHRFDRKKNQWRYFIFNTTLEMDSPIHEVEVIPKSVGANTGIRDENDKPIWVGDIVKVTCLKEKKFGKKLFAIVDYKDSQYVLSHKDNSVTLYYESIEDSILVVGNQIDTPSLLPKV